MPLGIKPTVDFAFKKIFGSPQNSLALMGLLNAILDFDRPIESAEVLNPFNYQEFAESKLIVLDVRCRDTSGRLLNVEMQVSHQSGLLQRLMYYACSMYVDQLELGQSYAQANAAISICLLSHRLFQGTDQAHHRFEMVDTKSGRELENTVEVHTVELPKYNCTEESISTASKLEQWAFLLLHAHEHTAESLNSLLPSVEFGQAISTIRTISAKTEDREMYDQHEKAQRDYQWRLNDALQAGREEGRQEGREEGKEQGILIGQILTIQGILGDNATPKEELLSNSKETLSRILGDLQHRLRERNA